MGVRSVTLGRVRSGNVPLLMYCNPVPSATVSGVELNTPSLLGELMIVEPLASIQIGLLSPALQLHAWAVLDDFLRLFML